MLTIGDFSRLSRVSPRMLRYYDALGLLHPQTVGENGYRYYRQEREVLLQELESRRAALRRLEGDILRMEGKHPMENQYHVILLEDPAQKVFSIRETIGVDQYHDFFQRLFQEAAARGLTQAGPIQMLYHNEDFDRNSSDVEAQMVVARDGPGVKIRPAYTCAAVQHRGPYEALHLAYEALCAWLAEHPEYRICGPAMDRYLNDDPDNTPPEDLVTGVLFPVEKI